MKRFYMLAMLTSVALLLQYSKLDAQVSGKVYRDYNSSGTLNGAENGVQGVTVTGVSSNGNTATAVTDANGNYTLNINGCAGQVRVSFDIDGYNDDLAGTRFDVYPSFAQQTAVGTGSQSATDVTFTGCTASNINLAVNNPEDYCQNQPRIGTNCYVNGDPTLGGTAIQPAAIIGFEYTKSGNGANYSSYPPTAGNAGLPDVLANNGATGATWGVSWDRRSESIFTSAVLKRHNGYGDLGAGGIYRITWPEGGNPTPSDFFDLDACTNLGAIVDNTSRNLPANRSDANEDIGAYSAVGKQGLGDLDISTDGTELWTVNMNTKQLIRIQIRNNPDGNIQTPDCNDVSTFNIPSPCGGNTRPFAVKYYRERVFVGIACQDASNAYAYEFNPDNGNFTQVLNFPLDYPNKGCSKGSNQGCEWHAWSDTFQDDIAGGFVTYPQPMFTDIEFDVDGSMIIGLSDRLGFQTGYQNNYGGNLRSGLVSGDILYAYNDNGTLVIEQNGDIVRANGSVVRNGCGNSAAKGVEFFCGDDSPCCDHYETSLGGLAINKTSGDVIMSAFDPGTSIWAGGVKWLDNETGNTNQWYAVFYNANRIDFAGKSTGIGDVELLCGLAPIEIGNRVWSDLDANGKQDPGEPGISDVTVQLKNAAGTVIATTTTRADGTYYFNDSNVNAGINPNTNYTICVPASNFGGALADLAPTTPNGGDDKCDSDGVQAGNGNVEVGVTTGEYGQSNHTYDFGFKEGNEAPVCSLITGNIQVGENLTFNILDYVEDADGNIDPNTVTFSNITPPLSGLFNTGAAPIITFSPATTFAGDVTFEYTITDEEGESCTGGGNIVVDDPCADGFSLVTTKTDPSSGGGGSDGSIEVTASNGNAPYTFVLSGPVAATQNGNSGTTFTNLPEGLYNIETTDAEGCVEETTVILSLICQLDVTTDNEDVICNGEANGSATATATDGATPFTYVWSNGFSETINGSSTINGLTAGTYNVTVTDNVGCEKERTVVVVEPSVITLSFTKDDVTTVGGNQGSITVFASGGTPDYTYTLNPGNVTNTTGVFTGLTSNTYQVTVEDAQGCQATIPTIVINEPNCDLQAVISNSSNVSCNGESDGSATVNVVGGDGVYTYEWLPTGGNEATANNLPAGTYTVNITSDDGNCTSSAFIEITEPSVLAAGIAATDITCFGFDNGELDLTVIGGTFPYTYQWTNLTGTVQPQDQINLAPGTYNVTVTDDNGCSVVTSATLDEPTELIVEIDLNNIVAPDGNNPNGGQLTAVGAGGTGTLNYSWSNGQGTATATGLTFNTPYIVTVTDVNGCTATDTYTFDDPCVDGITITIDTQTDPTSGNGGNDGVINVTATGSNPGFTYTLGGDGDATNTTGEFSGLMAGNYTITAIDDLGCEETISVTLALDCEMQIDFLGTDPLCKDGNDGEVTATPVDGTAPFTFVWNNGFSETTNGTSTIDGLSAGSYTVEVTDALGCVKIAGTILEAPDEIIPSIDNIVNTTTVGGSEGSITVSATNGTAPYDFILGGDAA